MASTIVTASVKNTFFTLEIRNQSLVRHKSMPAVHFCEQELQQKADFDRLSDSTRCPDSPSSAASAEVSLAPVRKDKMSRYCKKKAESHKTTVMIRNIPCKLSQEELMEEVSSVNPQFNFLYLPHSKKQFGNLGYAFVNFTTNNECLHFIEHFDGHVFERAPRSTKRGTAVFATLQGFKENVRFFQRSRVGKSTSGPYIA